MGSCLSRSVMFGAKGILRGDKKPGDDVLGSDAGGGVLAGMAFFGGNCIGV